MSQISCLYCSRQVSTDQIIGWVKCNTCNREICRQCIEQVQESNSVCAGASCSGNSRTFTEIHPANISITVPNTEVITNRQNHQNQVRLLMPISRWQPIKTKINNFFKHPIVVTICLIAITFYVTKFFYTDQQNRNIEEQHYTNNKKLYIPAMYQKNEPEKKIVIKKVSTSEKKLIDTEIKGALDRVNISPTKEEMKNILRQK